MSERVIFLDFDGVIRVAPEYAVFTGPDPAIFCPDRIERVRQCCRLLDARIVVSSDWRLFGGSRDNKPEIMEHLGVLATWLHDDWATPVCGHRWNEVTRWLSDHPEVTEYAVLEDFQPHFDGAPAEMLARVVWCNNRHGFVPELTGRLCALFSPRDSGASGAA